MNINRRSTLPSSARQRVRPGRAQFTSSRHLLRQLLLRLLRVAEQQLQQPQQRRQQLRQQMTTASELSTAGTNTLTGR